VDVLFDAARGAAVLTVAFRGEEQLRWLAAWVRPGHDGRGPSVLAFLAELCRPRGRLTLYSPILFACGGIPHNRTINQHRRFREESTDSRLHRDRQSNEATEKTRLSQPRDHGSRDHQNSKHTPANKPDSVARSFEPRSRITAASDLHSEKQDSQITSTDKGI
jgi:hypothetical protein